MFWQILLALFLRLAPASSLAAAPVTAQSPALAAAAAAPVVDSVEVSAFSPQKAPFRVRFGADSTSYRVMAMFALPGERVPVSVEGAGERARLEMTPAGGAAVAMPQARATWVAPRRAGLYPIEIRDAASGQAATLNVFVMVPYTAMRHGMLDGYRIGYYQPPRRGYEAEYGRPRGFVEVTPAVLDAQVAPHFTLAQFLCKEGGDRFPKYVVLREPLLVKLEELLERVNQAGIRARSFAIMSAYRTPSYNAAIGNVTIYSRHSYGDAADIFVDEDGDGVMDDLNHDGRHTLADARVLQGIVNRAEDDPAFAGLHGGLGTYAPTSEHGPFVHVDARGFDVRWGA